jgi:hypothetical protein
LRKLGRNLCIFCHPIGSTKNETALELGLVTIPVETSYGLVLKLNDYYL